MVTAEEKLLPLVLQNKYAKMIDISVRYSDNTIFAGEFDNVLEIRKSEDVLLVEMENKKRLVLKKYSCFGIIIEKL